MKVVKPFVVPELSDRAATRRPQVGQRDPGVLVGELWVIPVDDLAAEDLPDGVGTQLEVVGQARSGVVGDDDATAHVRELHVPRSLRRELRFLRVAQGHIGAGEVDSALDELCASGSRVVAVVGDDEIVVLCILDRLLDVAAGERRARAVELTARSQLTRALATSPVAALVIPIVVTSTPEARSAMAIRRRSTPAS